MGQMKMRHLSQITESESDEDSDSSSEYVPKQAVRKLRRMSVDVLPVTAFSTDVGYVPEAPFSHKIVKKKIGTLKEHDYELTNFLGGGKWGRVHTCIHWGSGKKFAAKCFKYQNQKKRKISGYIARVKQSQDRANEGKQELIDPKEVYNEVKIMNDLDHPNIIKLFDAIEEPKVGMTLMLE